MRGFIYLHNISLFTYNLKNVAPNNIKVNLNSSICDRSYFFYKDNKTISRLVREFNATGSVCDLP